jgi:DNA modification methylase
VSSRLLIGDAVEQLRRLPDESVHCCVTSPPYWGLRDYGADGQLGLEATPEEHVGAMVAVFEEVRRVLRSDGTLWLNYGDSYAHDGCGPQGDSPAARPKNRAQRDNDKRRRNNHGLKPKDLVGMPWRVAFALQAAGWYLRSDIIWHKPNPMPESVTDRPTSAHEYLFLLAKSPRYFYDADAIREGIDPASWNKTKSDGRAKRESLGSMARTTPVGRTCGNHPAGRNKRTVWTVATQPYSGAHFATFPPRLITPCIMAGTSERGCCSGCGAPWVRVVDKGGLVSSDGRTGSCGAINQGGVGNSISRAGISYYGMQRRERSTTGWRPSCECNAAPEPCTVLDPFGGSGTTAEVAEALGRRWILIELNPDYEPLIRRRTAQMGLFAKGAA